MWKERLFEGFRVGRESFHLEMLQSTDDIIFFCFGREDSFVNLNHILYVFELILGLKIKRCKNVVLGINCESSKLNSLDFSSWL